MFENILWAKAAEQAGETSLDMIEKMIQYQHSLLANTLTVLVVIAGLIAAASLVYNIYISRKKLEDIKSDIISELAEKAREAAKGELVEMEKEVDKKIMITHAHATRGFYRNAAITLSDRYKDFSGAATQWTRAASNSDLLEEYEDARRQLNLAISELKRCKSIDKSIADEIKKRISPLHASLNPEKEEIEELLKKLRTKQKRGDKKG